MCVSVRVRVCVCVCVCARMYVRVLSRNSIARAVLVSLCAYVYVCSYVYVSLLVCPYSNTIASRCSHCKLSVTVAMRHELAHRGIICS